MSHVHSLVSDLIINNMYIYIRGCVVDWYMSRVLLRSIYVINRFLRLEIKNHILILQKINSCPKVHTKF